MVSGAIEKDIMLVILTKVGVVELVDVILTYLLMISLRPWQQTLWFCLLWGL